MKELSELSDTLANGKAKEIIVEVDDES